MKTLVKNGGIVTAVGDYRADILVENKMVYFISELGYNS